MWSQYDATELVGRVSAEHKFDDILIDVGTADGFLKNGQLLPEAFEKACNEAGQRVTLNMREGYDHSYFFISTFMADHINFHASRLRK